ncbi:hypothetical protein [Virgibacillus senegalensis]|nr:hypothetical protein [Virgibacillus senegalensis]
MEKDKDKVNYKQSYESDGKMGKDKQRHGKTPNYKDEKMFFNTTEASE